MKLDLFHDRRHKVSWHRARKPKQLFSGRNNHVVHPEDIDEVLVEDNLICTSRHSKSIMHPTKEYSTLCKEEYPQDEVFLQTLEMDVISKEDVRDADVIMTTAEHVQVQVAEAIPLPEAKVEHAQQTTDDDIVPYVEAQSDCVAAPTEIALEAFCVQVPNVESASVDVVFEEKIQAAESHNSSNALTFDADQEVNSMPTTNLRSPVPVMRSNDLLKINMDSSLKKKLARSVNGGEFTPYGEFYGGARRGDQQFLSREERRVHRLVALAKMHCANPTFSQRPNTTHIQYVHSLGLFYASQPILTTKPNIEAPPAVLPDVTQLLRRKEIPVHAPSETSTNEKKTSRKRLLAHLRPWLWHFPSPRSFGKVAHEPTFVHEQPQDLPMIDNEHVVRRILI